MKKLGILFILLIFFISPSYSNELTEDYFDMAQNYLQTGNTQKALEYVNYVLTLIQKLLN